MITDTNNKVIYFNTDDELYKYVVVPQIIEKERVNATGEVTHYADFDLSRAYYDDLDNSVEYIIRDKNSQIYKHKGVSYRTITKKLDNLKPWYYEQIYNNQLINNGI